MRTLSLDEKALRRARLDDWCARNRVETIPASPQAIPPDELEAMASRKLNSHFWGRRRLDSKTKGGRKTS